MSSVPPPLEHGPEVPEGVEPAPLERQRDGLAAVPAWAPLAAMVAAFFAATIGYLVIAAGVQVGGGEVTADGPPGVIITATLVQDVALIAAALGFSSLWARGLAPESFGLRLVPLRGALGWSAAAFVGFWILTAIYLSIVGEPDQQELTRDLKEEESALALAAYGVLLAFVAPLAEEFFFRGFMFGVLARRIGPWAGALATGVIFGLVHVAGSPIETVGVLVILGVVLCGLYWKTGSLLPCIALHAINNAISFGATKSLPWPAFLAVVLGATGACLAVAELAIRHARPTRPAGA